MNRLAIPVFLACMAIGCISVGGGSSKSPEPRYALLTARPEAGTRNIAPPVVATNGLVVVGRVKTPGTLRNTRVRWMDAKSGQVGTLRGGELEATPDALVSEAMRAWLSASGRYGAVTDLGVAPRNRNLLLLEAWVEEFGVERDAAGAWTARVALRVYAEPASNEFFEVPLTATRPLVVKHGRAPSVEDAVKALSSALVETMEKLEKRI
jgi:hypothetical protein